VADKKELKAEYLQRRRVGGVFKIENAVTGKILLSSGADIKSCENRFLFSQNTGSCSYLKMQEDWGRYGPGAFSFFALETLEKKSEQSEREFLEDIKTLEELWREKLSGREMY